MPNIRPVSDLRSYSDVLQEVEDGSPVFLTKNGRGRYVLMDIREYEKRRAMDKLMDELEKGRISGEQEGYFTLEEMRERFCPNHNGD